MHVILHLILKCDPLDHHLIINLGLYLVKENPPWQDPALSQRYNACDPPSDPSHPLSHLILKFDTLDHQSNVVQAIPTQIVMYLIDTCVCQSQLEQNYNVTQLALFKRPSHRFV